MVPKLPKRCKVYLVISPHKKKRVGCSRNTPSPSGFHKKANQLKRMLSSVLSKRIMVSRWFEDAPSDSPWDFGGGCRC